MERLRGSAAEAGRFAPNGDWLRRLAHEGRERDEALAELHCLLVKSARFTLARRRQSLPELHREQLDDLAVEAADDALIAVLAHLDDYRGESLFTTWVWKFGVLQASVVAKRRAWMGRELPFADAGWATPSLASLDSGLEDRELLAELRRAVDEDLTDHQRTVFVALALNGVPVDVLAERIGTTRGSVYKTLYDARQKLRARLAAYGSRE